MSAEWSSLILDAPSAAVAWDNIFSKLQKISQNPDSAGILHDATVAPDRILSEAAWELWVQYPEQAAKTAVAMKTWCKMPASSGRAVLILDALSLREMSFLLKGAANNGINNLKVSVTGSECPSTTDQFAKALGAGTRGALANNKKTASFDLFGAGFHTDVVDLPFEDCCIPPTANILIWHTWLDDLIHTQKKSSEQIAKNASDTLQSEGFWLLVNKLRKGRPLLITSDHGYAVSKRFSSEVEEPEAINILREAFGASRSIVASEPWKNQFMPPIVMSHGGYHVVTGQRKWKAPGGFPAVCHGGMSLLEVAVPFIEVPAL